MRRVDGRRPSDAGHEPRANAETHASGLDALSEERFVSRDEGNLYFWYYATLALFQRGGEAWDRWNEAMQLTLLPEQEGDASWPPIDPYAAIAGDDASDRSYATTTSVLMLEVYYRYVAPRLRWRSASST